MAGAGVNFVLRYVDMFLQVENLYNRIREDRRDNNCKTTILADIVSIGIEMAADQVFNLKNRGDLKTVECATRILAFLSSIHDAIKHRTSWPITDLLVHSFSLLRALCERKEIIASERLSLTSEERSKLAKELEKRGDILQDPETLANQVKIYGKAKIVARIAETVERIYEDSLHCDVIYGRFTPYTISLPGFGSGGGGSVVPTAVPSHGGGGGGGGAPIDDPYGPIDVASRPVIIDIMEADSVLQRHVCPITMRAIRKAAQCQCPHRHIFEKTALIDWMNIHHDCPTSRLPLHCVESNPVIQRIIDERLTHYNDVIARAIQTEVDNS